MTGPFEDLRRKRDLEPLTQLELERRLDELDDQVVALIEGMEELTTADAEAEHAYKLAFSKALIAAEGRDAEYRKAKATEATEKLLWAHLTAAAKLRAAKSIERLLLGRLSSAQSLNANVRGVVDRSRGEGG